MRNQLSTIVSKQGFVVFDGGVSSELEFSGVVLNSDLWSSIEVLRNPALVEAVHKSFYAAGADVATACCYQACTRTVAACGLPSETLQSILQDAVRVAKSAAESSRQTTGPGFRLCAASVGSYGSSMLGGHEFTGAYDISGDERAWVIRLKEFHYSKALLLAAQNPDLLMFETVPCGVEVEAILEMMTTDHVLSAVPYTISVSCGSGTALCNGDSFADVVDRVRMHVLREIQFRETPLNLAGFGINCTSPHLIHSLLSTVGKTAMEELAASQVCIFANPNSGEYWNPESRVFESVLGAPSGGNLWTEWIPAWWDLGVRGFGGCCRIRPSDISRIREILQQQQQQLTSHSEVGSLKHWQ
eukprot:ANDGO_03219.mRNA.1 Homocysteine S-methyltransferase 1